MIIIANQYKTKITSFESYWDVFQYIEEQEKPRQTRSPQNLLPEWSFVIHPYQRALHFHSYMEETLKTQIGSKNDRQGLNVLELRQGSIGKVSLLPVTPELKIEDIKQQWCAAYLRAKGYFSLKADDLSAFMKPW